MELKRKSWIFIPARALTNIYVDYKYKLNITGIENIPKHAAALLLVKHQYKSDIYIEGKVLDKYSHRPANWLMKSSFPNYVEKIGGIRVVRLKDAKKIKNKQKRKRFLEKAEEINYDSLNYIKWLYTQGEIVIVHPEGTRVPLDVKKVHMPVINATIAFEKKMYLDIPIIPIGICYENIKEKNSEVYFNIGNPLNINKPNLENTLQQELKYLSHIKF